MAPEQPERNEGTEIEEPPNSTVDDWFGQNVARDQEVADRAVEEAGGDVDEAEERFEQEAEGKERYDEGHDRPDGGT
jgi:hypothetical protein